MRRFGRWALLACALQPAALALAAAPAAIVVQSHRAFSVREVHLKRGESVRFVNSDEFIHHVYVRSPGFTFDSGEQEPGHDVDVVFPVAGTFDVRCEIHPRMVLTVAVE